MHKPGGGDRPVFSIAAEPQGHNRQDIPQAVCQLRQSGHEARATQRWGEARKAQAVPESATRAPAETCWHRHCFRMATEV